MFYLHHIAKIQLVEWGFFLSLLQKKSSYQYQDHGFLSFLRYNIYNPTENSNGLIKLLDLFNNNPETYPELVGNTLPIAIATTTTNSSTGNQVVDISQVQTGILLVVPALIEGTTIEIGGIKVLRGTGSRRKELSTNNGTNWFSIGTPIIVGNKSLVLSGLGSPVVLTVENYNPNTSKNPSTVLDYLFYFCYPVSFIGATFYGVVSIINVDPATIIANKNVSIAINIYIGLCAIMSVFIWFNYQNPILGRNLYNQNSSKKKNV